MDRPGARAWGAGLLLLAALSGLTVAAQRPGRVAVPRKEVGVSKETGLVFQLREGGEEPAAPASTTPPAPATLLSGPDTQRVLDRLPALPPEPTPPPFALRESSLPPPRTGATVKDAFPPPSGGPGPGPVATGPLQVLRHAPEGEVPLSANLSVTFSQAMVDLASVSELAAEAVPVRLTPQPAGRWRWVGTRTLLFEPEGGRFPMATAYAVEVPAGTRSATGATLAQAVKWTFGTPPPALTASHPGDQTVRRDALLFAAFDQKIDPAAVLAVMQASAGTTRPVLRLATAEEVAADETVKALAQKAGAGRWLALRGREPLPADSAVTITLPVGTPSAEGPRRTAKEQSWTFRTFGPLRLTEHRCGWNDRCPPGTPWQLHFSNAIDEESLRPDLVRVEPSLPGQVVDVSREWITLRGRSRGRTKYTVTVGPELRDEFGQTLGQPAVATFTTTEAVRQLVSTADTFVVLDPATPPRFSVWSAGFAKVRARAYAVAPGDWPRFMTFQQDQWRNTKGAAPPGRPVLDATVAVGGDADELSETRIDLAQALPGGAGNAVVIVEGIAAPGSPKEEYPTRPVLAWVQATHIGLSAFADGDELLGWANTLADGAPLAGLELELLATGGRGTTDAQGLARIPLPGTGAYGLLARRGAETAFLPAQTGWWSPGQGWQKQVLPPQLHWMLFDDRGMYRPGEEVKLKGWARVVGLAKGGDVEAWQEPVHEAAYVLRDSRSNDVAKGTTAINAYGGFELSLKLPPTMNLGSAYLTLTAAGWGGSGSHVLQVQEFRRPEYEVTASASQAPHFVGGSATVTVSAQYFAGGSLTDTPVHWTVSAAPTIYRPPNRDEFTFGRWTPWWEAMDSGAGEGAATRQRTFEGRTDGGGRHRLAIDFESVDPALPSSVTAEARIMDVNRQAWSARSTLLVHPADVYVGLRLQKPFVDRGARYALDAIATDLDGAAVSGRTIEVVAERLEWKHGNKGWTETPVEAGRCTLTSAAEAVRCDLRAGEGGTYRIRATVEDARGRHNLSEARLWVSGARTAEDRGLQQEKVTLVPDKREYRAGETAEVLLVSPLVPAEGLLTLRRSGLVRSERFRLTESTHTLRIPIEEGFVPNLHVQVDLVGSAAREDAKNVRRPAFASGTVSLSVPPFARTLSVAVSAQDKALAPGAHTRLDVVLKDAAGRPVPRGEVALVVVDEAVLALTGYKLPDPLAFFYDARPPGVSDHHLRSSVTLGVPAEQGGEEDKATLAFEAQTGGRVGGLADGAVPPPPAAAPAMRAKSVGFAAEKPEPIRMRTDFTPLALFAASVVTDADGHAQVPLTVPDNLTRYRVMAVAATRGAQFGSGESTVTVRLPLMVRPSAPRFLNFGDRFELPVVVQNQTDHALPVDVAVRAQGLSLTAGAGRRLSVPAGDRVEVRFPMAVEHVGTARVQVGALSGGDADAAEITLPVWTPATTEAFAVYGTLDAGAVVQPVRPPAGAVPQFGGLEMSTSSTALQSLTDAVIYLVSYPFECSEQLSSRVLGVAALRDVLAAFKAEGLPAPKEMEAAVARDLDLLRRIQNDDGGFPFWRRGDPSWPYVTIHVALALERAKAKGFSVPGDMLERAHGYLKSIESHIPSDYPDDVRRSLIAYALNVRHRLGDSDRVRARALVREAGVEKLSFEALGWLLPVLGPDAGSKAEADLIRRRLANNVSETAGAAHFAVSYGEAGPYLLLSSDRRADAIVLEALIADQPKSDLIPKIVDGLLGHRTAGHWLNTQENVFILLALDRYFQAYEKVTPDFVARAWLGEQMVGEQQFRGRSTDRHEVNVPMAVLVEGGRRDLVLSKEGAGRLYYRLGLRYAPSSLHLDPLDAGFTVERKYEAVDAPADVRRDADGTWHIRAGARVRVRLTMATTGRRNHVALVDPLPAGLEALNSALAVTESVPPGPSDTVDVMGAPGWGGPGRGGHWWWWRRTWWEHQNLRDERAEAFTSLLFEGVYTYSYVARATTPGAFVVPPTKAEEMYHPETFGRAGTDRVIVE